MDEFGKKLKYILDGGRSKIGIESTIISLIGKPKIIRLGGIETKELEKVLKLSLIYKDKINFNFPGQSKLHYSPGIPIELNKKKPKKNSAYILINKRNVKNKNFFYLSKNNNLKEAAQNLYKLLRKIKKKKYKLIEIEKIPEKGFGLVINDRLKRASYK